MAGQSHSQVTGPSQSLAATVADVGCCLKLQQTALPLNGQPPLVAEPSVQPATCHTIRQQVYSACSILQDASSEQLILQPQAVAIRYLDVVAEKVIIQHPEIPTGSVTGKKLLDAGVLLFKGASGGHAKVKWPTPGKPEPEAKHCGNTNTAAYALKRMRPDWREALGLPPSTLIKVCITDSVDEHCYNGDVDDYSQNIVLHQCTTRVSILCLDVHGCLHNIIYAYQYV